MSRAPKSEKPQDCISRCSEALAVYMEEKAKQANIRENDVIVSLQSTCPENSLSAAAKLFLAAQIAQPRNLSSHPENERRFAT